MRRKPALANARGARNTPRMNDDVPFAVRRRETIEKATAIFSADPRIRAGWLEGSLADGSADPFSDIDLYLCVADAAWNEVWPNRRDFISRVRPILAAADVMGVFGIGCLLEGPVKLDVFFERESTLAAKQRVAVKRLWGPEEIFSRLRIGDDLGDEAIKRALEYNVMGFLQGATWPVRILARGQHHTFYYNELLLIETGLVPLMLLEQDRRAYHRNMFTRAKRLTPAQHAEYIRLMDYARTAIATNDRAAILAMHLEIFRKLCALARAAFERYGLTFPPRVEDEMISFYQREWPA
jgi:hypothetical protein